jgi:hypothetical protein
MSSSLNLDICHSRSRAQTAVATYNWLKLTTINISLVQKLRMAIVGYLNTH